jgi:hypothetical protein
VAYSRRQPETTLLYRTLQEHWLGFLGEIEAGGGELPAFVRDEFRAYFRCGILVWCTASPICSARAVSVPCWWRSRAAAADSVRRVWAVACASLWTETLDLAEARPPPYFRSITRLKPTRQVELFE